MQTIRWDCCPLVAQNPVMRAWISQIAREGKSASTIENYSRDLNDFLFEKAFVDKNEVWSLFLQGFPGFPMSVNGKPFWDMC